MFTHNDKVFWLADRVKGKTYRPRLHVPAIVMYHSGVETAMVRILVLYEDAERLNIPSGERTVAAKNLIPRN